jgi:cell division protease FtsH
MDEETQRFASDFQTFMHRMAEAAQFAPGSDLAHRLDTHIGAEAANFPVVTEGFQSYDHANVQVALNAYLAAEGRSHELVGLAGEHRHFGSLSDLLQMGQMLRVRPGSVDLVNLPVGPRDTMACIQFGFVLVDDRGSRFAVLVRGSDDLHGYPTISLEVLCANPDVAREFLAQIRELIVTLNVFRGQVVSFGSSQMGHPGTGPVAFLPRPDMEREDLVLGEGVLEAVERQVFGVAEHRDRLRESGQHVKRGLLLHGPPGTGKTLTVRYVASRVRDHTIVLLTGGGLHLVRHACSLARMLQPAVVVLEDVDLVALERGMSEYGNPVLFDVLNEMDGIEEDADVTFLLTTNRADLLEPALAARPGRVDLAVEIALPDDGGRRRLIELYGRGLDLRLEDVDSVVARTEGVTASFIKELMRKAALLAATRSDGQGPVVVTDVEMGAALDELLAESGALTRSLLGGSDGEAGVEPSGRGRGWLHATPWVRLEAE